MRSTPGREGRRLLTRVLAPGALLLGLVVTLGFLLTPPGIVIPIAEESFSRELARLRTDGWDEVTLTWSLIGNFELIVGVGVVVALLILAGTRNWRLAAVPVLATALQHGIFMAAAHLVDRPRPPVERLDATPPTPGFPSGHVGASTALYGALALLALAIRLLWLRWLTVLVCLTVPLLVAYGRLYRGMHFPTDVAVGFLNGITCALLAYGWYRSDRRLLNQ